MITKTTNPEELSHKTGSETLQADAAKAKVSKASKASGSKKRNVKAKAKASAGKAKRVQRVASKRGLEGTAKITIVAKKNPFKNPKSKRARKWACLKNGITVSAAVEKMEKENLPSRQGFLTFCKEQGHITLSK